MDKVSFSIFIIGNTSEKEFFEALTNLGFGKCKYDYLIKDKKKKYQRRRKYIVENSVIIFTYQRKNDVRYLPDICCAYQNPSRPVLDLLDSLCNSLGFVAKVSQIELAIDFPYTRKLKRFFNKYLYLKFNRGNPCVVGKGVTKSYYSGHKEKNSKTTIVYQKIIKRLNLGLRMEGVNNLDLSQFLSFRKFNEKKYFKYHKWLNRYKLCKTKTLFRSLHLRIIQEASLNYTWINFVMPGIAHLKKRGHQRPQRFFDDMPKTNREFYKLVQGKQFLR